jgi:dUTP pyrophosphatase
MFKLYNNTNSTNSKDFVLELKQNNEPKYQLNIKINSENKQLKDYYEKFSSHHLGDSGIDLFNFNEIIINHLQVGTIDFEIQCELIDLSTNEFISYFLVPRSSLANTEFQMANSIGIIDAGYRGNIKAKVRNFNIDKSTFKAGSYFQIVACDLKPIKVKLVNELSKTTRNDGGFGSTNK